MNLHHLLGRRWNVTISPSQATVTIEDDECEFSSDTATPHNALTPHHMERSILYSTVIVVRKVPPLRVTLTESVNRIVECCVQITGPDMSTTIQRDNFSLCVSTIDGTAVGKNILYWI